MAIPSSKPWPAPPTTRAGERGALPAAMTALFREEHARLVQRLIRVVGTPEDAEDVAQTAFIRLFDAVERVDQIHSLRGYLYRVAHNLAIDHVRRRALTQRIFDPVDVGDHEISAQPTGALDFHDQHDARRTLGLVAARLDELPPKCQRAFLLSKVNENSFPEIASEMSLSVSMIEKYVSRALTHVRRNVSWELAA